MKKLVQARATTAELIEGRSLVPTTLIPVHKYFVMLRIHFFLSGYMSQTWLENICTMKIKKKLNIKSSFNVKVSRFLATFQCQLSVKTKRRNSDPNTDPTKVRNKKYIFTFVQVLKNWIREKLLVLLSLPKPKEENEKTELKKCLLQVWYKHTVYPTYQQFLKLSR